MKRRLRSRATLRRALRRLWLRSAPRHFIARGRPTTAELGAAGEELAARVLLGEGWRLCGRRVRTPVGEVDLWAERNGRSWVIEVKTGHVLRLPRIRGHPRLPRWDLRWRPGLSLDARQRERLFRAARYLGRVSGLAWDVALVEVLVATDGRVVEVLSPARMVEGERAPYTRAP